MASDRWKTFTDAVADVHSTGSPVQRIGLLKLLEVKQWKRCPSPDWDPHTPYRVALVRGQPQIQKFNLESQWVEVDIHPPKTLDQAVTSRSTKGADMDLFKTKTRSILFMDVSGWSKLSGHQIYSYVTKVMPKLAEQIQDHEMLNTWGDAIVATFESAKDAAESALRIRDVFERTYQHQGMPPDLKCRISLNVGEIIICHNDLTDREDIFGHAVHTAARLEPLTAPGHVFCTKLFADTLGGLEGSVPKTWPVGELTLPKKFGKVEACVVTSPNQSDPRPGLKEFLKPDEGSAAPTAAPPPEVVSEKTAKLRLESWLDNLPVETRGAAIRFVEVDAKCDLPRGTAARFLPNVIAQYKGNWKLKDHSDTDFILLYDDGVRRYDPNRGPH